MRAKALDRWNGEGVWPLVALVQMMLIGGLAAWLALRWAPEPISDWLLYWNTAGNPDRYERGGIGLWLLALPKSLGAQAHTASFVLNLAAAACLCRVIYQADRTRWRLFAQAVVAYLLLTTPYFGIVQLDLLGTAALVSGLWLLLEAPPPVGRKGMSLTLAVLAMVVAVSTRPQFALILWALVALLAFAMLVWRKWRTRRLVLMAVGLLLGSVIGFCVDMGLRGISGRTEQIRTSSAVTLYAGLLVSSDSRTEGCGYWSTEAAHAAREDLHKPMWDAIGDRLAAQPPAYWARVLKCKAPQIVAPPPYALYWFAEAPNLARWREQHPQRSDVEALQARAYRIEGLAYRLLGALLLLTTLVTAAKALAERRWDAPVLLSGWILSFWGVHAVFEIQGRYFIGFYLGMIVLCALLWSPRRWAADAPGEMVPRGRG